MNQPNEGRGRAEGFVLVDVWDFNRFI